MIKSANQLYKESGTKLSFKEWLKTEQRKGTLRNFEAEKMFNATGSRGSNADKLLRKQRMNNIIGVAGVALLAIGLWQVTKKQSI